MVELVMRLESQEAAAHSELAVMRVRIAELEAMLQVGHTGIGAYSESSSPQAVVRRGSGRFKKRGMQPADGLPRTTAPATDLYQGGAADNLLRAGVSTESPPRVDEVDNLSLRTFVAAKDPPRADHPENLPQRTTGAAKNIHGENAAATDDVSASATNPREVDHVETLLRTANSAKNPQRVNHVENLLRADTPAQDLQRAALTDGARSARQTSQQHAAAQEESRPILRASAPPPTLPTPATRPAALIVPRRVNEHDAEQRRMQSNARTGNPPSVKTAPSPPLPSLITAASQRKEPASLSVPGEHRLTQPPTLSAHAHAESRKLWTPSGSRKAPAVRGSMWKQPGEDQPVDHVGELLRESPKKNPTLGSLPKVTDYLDKLLREQSDDADDE